MILNRMAVCGIFLVLAIGVPSLTRASYVINGSFETYTGGYNGSPSKLSDTNSPQTNYTILTGWNVITNLATFDPIADLFGPGTAETTGSYQPNDLGSTTFWGTLNGGPNVIPASSPDGGNFLAMTNAPMYQVGISQTLSNLTIGQTYAVSFYWAGAQQYAFNGASTAGIQVSLGASSQETNFYSNPGHGFSGWMSQTFDFTADNTSDVLKFIAIGSNSWSLLDGVQVNAVPEPASFTLMGIAITCFAACCYRCGRMSVWL